jgi:hypothetical protein
MIEHLMKRILLFSIFAILCLTYVGCKKCRNENPRARIVNNGTDKVSVQIQTSGGNTVNINNIMPGTASEFAHYAPGAVQFTIAFQVANDTSLSVTMQECWEYDIIVNENDDVTSVPTDRNE